MAFDDDWAKGVITKDGYNVENASDSGALAYKLLCQTGDQNNPHERSQVGFTHTCEGTIV